MKTLEQLEAEALAARKFKVGDVIAMEGYGPKYVVSEVTVGYYWLLLVTKKLKPDNRAPRGRMSPTGHIESLYEKVR